MSCCGTDMSDLSGSHPATSDQATERAFLAASQPVDDKRRRIVVQVPDMHCGGCISRIEKNLRVIDGIDQVRANLSHRHVTIVWRPGRLRGSTIMEALSGLGFSAHMGEDSDALEQHLADRGRQLLLALAVAGFASANIMLLSVSVWSGATAETAQLFHLISGLIAVPAVLFSGRPFFSSALGALSHRRLNMDVPISLAVLLALGMSVFEAMTGGEEAYFDASVMLLFFLLIGRTLDHRMRQRARGAVTRLAGLVAPFATRIMDNGHHETVALEDIREGMALRVLPGERFAVDGRIVSGASDIDRSLVSGESLPVSATRGTKIEAGTLNLTGPVTIRATGTAEQSYLAEMRRMMAAAEQGRGRYQRVAERMASIYAPAVHLLALITFICWMVWTAGDVQTSLYAAIAVLIITCPCALGLAVPVVHVVGASRLFDAGILMRDGSAFERMAEIDHAVFDKTGTLTTGEPELAALPQMSATTRNLVAALAKSSSHPVSRRLARMGGASAHLTLRDISERPGYGIEAHFEGARLRLGRPDWVAEIAAGGPIASDISVAFAREGDAPLCFALSETERPDAKAMMQELAHRSVKTELLSGDNPAAVARLAASVGLADWRASVTPADKIARMEELTEGGRKVLMVGDGLNDAPALAAAFVSMAPASGSDVGRLASDFVFTRPSLKAVTFAHAISRRTARLIRQNFGLAITYNCIAVPLAMAGFVTPLVAAIAMSASSVVVVANSLRLRLERHDAGEAAIAEMMDKPRAVSPRLVEESVPA